VRGAEDGVDQAGKALVELGAGWRWAFLMPAPVALVTLVAGARLLPVTRAPRLHWARIDVVGAVLLTSAMLLVVYTLVEAPAVGWRSARTSGSLLAFGVLLAAFVGYEAAGVVPARSPGRPALVDAGSRRAWRSSRAASSSQVLSSRIAPLIERFGVIRMAVAGLTSLAIGYALFLPIGLDSRYVAAMLLTFLLGGLGFALAFGPVNIAATSGVPPEEQGLAGALLNTSFQFGAALVLAVVTAVADATTGSRVGPQATLDGFHAALFVPLVAVVVGALALLVRRRTAAVIEFAAVSEEAVEEAA
jgi:MFS family permease